MKKGNSFCAIFVRLFPEAAGNIKREIEKGTGEDSQQWRRPDDDPAREIRLFVREQTVSIVKQMKKTLKEKLVDRMPKTWSLVDILKAACDLRLELQDGQRLFQDDFVDYNLIAPGLATSFAIELCGIYESKMMANWRQIVHHQEIAKDNPVLPVVIDREPSGYYLTPDHWPGQCHLDLANYDPATMRVLQAKWIHFDFRGYSVSTDPNHFMIALVKRTDFQESLPGLDLLEIVNVPHELMKEIPGTLF